MVCSFAISIDVQAFDVNNEINIPWSHAVTCHPGVRLQEFVAIFGTWCNRQEFTKISKNSTNAARRFNAMSQLTKYQYVESSFKCIHHFQECKLTRQLKGSERSTMYSYVYEWCNYSEPVKWPLELEGFSRELLRKLWAMFFSRVRYFIYLHFLISCPSLLDDEIYLHNL